MKKLPPIRRRRWRGPSGRKAHADAVAAIPLRPNVEPVLPMSGIPFTPPRADERRKQP